jgi:type IV fimbrial biogenesis protein FimT
MWMMPPVFGFRLVARSARAGDNRAFSAVELMLTVSVLGILMAVGVPAFLSYWRSAELQGGAQELATILNRARQLAIAQNTSVCVNQSANKVQLLIGGCGGTVWLGTGTNGAGWFTLQNSINVSSTTANVVFNYLGAAPTAGVYTVQNPLNSRTMSVTVALSGRVTVGP